MFSIEKQVTSPTVEWFPSIQYPTQRNAIDVMLLVVALHFRAIAPMEDHPNLGG
jgi:hypothetical protein